MEGAGIGLAILACSHAVAAGEGALPAIAAIGHFYVAGREAPHGAPGARIETGQVYVHYVRLARPRLLVPLLLIPGGSLSGAAYETTPDGRPGWQSDFLAAGYSVLVADSGQTGRTPPAPLAAGAAPPAIRDKAFLWETFRIGPPGSWRTDPGARRPYPSGRFPLAGFDAFARQVFPRYRPPLDEEVARTAALYDRACPCVVVAHSAAGPIAERAALLRPIGWRRWSWSSLRAGSHCRAIRPPGCAASRTFICGATMSTRTPAGATNMRVPHAISRCCGRRGTHPRPGSTCRDRASSAIRTC
ncbi:hypothetical protein ACFSTI_16670 [Rhizorhabdus histidinilytica]